MNQDLMDAVYSAVREEVGDYEYLEVRDGYEKVRQEGDEDEEGTFLRITFDKTGRPSGSEVKITEKLDTVYDAVMEVSEVTGVKRIYGQTIRFEIHFD